MSQLYNIYCDESCHLEKDRQRAMVLGAVWCPLDKAQEIAVRLREIKAHHGMKPGFETKWTKVSPAKKLLKTAFMVKGHKRAEFERDWKAHQKA